MSTPAVVPSEVFPRSCDEYASHLGDHQAEAFRLLWSLPSSGDPLMNADNAHWHIVQGLRASRDALRIAPAELLTELHEGARRVLYREGRTDVDVTYTDLFVKIADWQHELLDESMTALVNDLYQPVERQASAPDALPARPEQGAIRVADPILLAKRATLEGFLATYDPAVTPFFASASTGLTVLFGALANRDPATRVAIATRLLDDGANASAVTKDGMTVLHVLLTQRAHDPVAEAPLLKRLLDGGADVNRIDPRFGAPLAMLYNAQISDEDSVPLYEVFFERPDLDLDGRASKAHTVRQLILDAAPRNRPILQQMVRERSRSAGGGDDRSGGA